MQDVAGLALRSTEPHTPDPYDIQTERCGIFLYDATLVIG